MDAGYEFTVVDNLQRQSVNYVLCSIKQGGKEACCMTDGCVLEAFVCQYKAHLDFVRCFSTYLWTCIHCLHLDRIIFTMQ